MSDLYDIQRQLVARIGTAPVGSALRFRLMDAADAVSAAIEAEAKHGAQTGGFDASTASEPSNDGQKSAAPNSEDTTR